MTTPSVSKRKRAEPLITEAEKAILRSWFGTYRDDKKTLMRTMFCTSCGRLGLNLMCNKVCRAAIRYS